MKCFYKVNRHLKSGSAKREIDGQKQADDGGTKGMTRIVRNYLVIVLGILFMGGIGLSYVGRSARDVLFMDYWRYINDILPSVLNGSFGIEELLLGDFGQRNFLIRLLLALNIKYLNLNCLVEVYGGIIVLMIISILLYFILGDC